MTPTDELRMFWVCASRARRLLREPDANAAELASAVDDMSALGQWADSCVLRAKIAVEMASLSQDGGAAVAR